MSKINIRAFMLVIVCVLISAFLVACNNTDDPNTHTHTYSTEWTSDESHHWHAATCEHTEEVADKGTHVRGEDDTCSTCGYEMPPVTVDDGHSILSAEGYDISGTVLTKKDRFSKDTEQYDLRGAFEISEGATWNVFTSADCKTEDWLPNRIVTLEQGENSVYVLVEDKTGNNSTVYEVRLYRRSEVTVTVVYNESEQKKIDIEEDSPILSTLGDSVLGDYIYYKYYLDSAFTSELSAELTATEDIPLYVDAYYVGVSLSGGTVVGLNANTRPSGTFKLLIDNSLLGVTVTKIGEDAFRDMENMTECTLPDTVTGIEGSAFRGCKALKKIDLPDSLTQIKGSAFSSCESLTEITIPENVESIGNYAFFDCKNLKTVYYNAKRCADISTKSYDDGVFVHTFSLSDLVIDKFQIGKTVQYVPSNLFATDTDPESGSGDFEQPMYIKSLVFEEESTCTAIGKYAFAYKRCYDSGEVEYSGTVVGDIFIPSSVDEIGDFAFGSTPWAENVYIASDVESYFKLAQKTSLANNIYIKGELLTSVTIPDSYSSIGAYWFSYVHSIKHVTIPEGITSIPAKAFYACIGLCSVDIPASVSSIGNSAFTYCRELKEIVIPDAVSTIPENCFDSCYKLYKITLPKKLDMYYNNSFTDCFNLVEIYNRSSLNIRTLEISDTLMNIYTDKSGESIINKLTGGFVTVKKGDTVLLVGYTGEERDVVIPSSVHEINQYVFYHSDIDSVRIGGATKKINSYAFAQSSLKSVVINGIADLTIGEYAFAFCEQLETLTIGENVTAIGAKAFYAAKSLKVVYLGDRVKTVGDYAFFRCNAIETVNYTGTKVEWNTMQIADGNDTLTDAERSYNCEI